MNDDLIALFSPAQASGNSPLDCVLIPFGVLVVAVLGILVYVLFDLCRELIRPKDR